jgi:hypothetical protein
VFRCHGKDAKPGEVFQIILQTVDRQCFYYAVDGLQDRHHANTSHHSKAKPSYNIQRGPSCYRKLKCSVVGGQCSPRSTTHLSRRPVNVLAILALCHQQAKQASQTQIHTNPSSRRNISTQSPIYLHLYPSPCNLCLHAPRSPAVICTCQKAWNQTFKASTIRISLRKTAKMPASNNTLSLHLIPFDCRRTHRSLIITRAVVDWKPSSSAPFTPPHLNSPVHLLPLSTNILDT